jgi:hypothetical protein
MAKCCISTISFTVQAHTLSGSNINLFAITGTKPWARSCTRSRDCHPMAIRGKKWKTLALSRGCCGMSIYWFVQEDIPTKLD